MPTSARDAAAVRQWWASLPPGNRPWAIDDTDFGAAAGAVRPTKRLQAVGNETAKTSDMERFNQTWRQRVSRLVRKTVSFAKSGEHHIGALWSFIHHYNASLLVSHYRKTFFDDWRALTRYLFYFERWDHRLTFMLEGLELEIPPNTS